ncbi:siderophore-interacting protein [Microbacterium sp. PRC9]|uniref:siderophore-interacting protein n=1 Tax=Microbacterium sp. PRC9 TaxID=2962591 RepID=UPI002881060F|nr:siderophore-interacting protein [Microbacterium sp. PRC9]MDT0144540.1 siderophore-interacting protein [Microbacterium sp. PRC9]
MVRTERIAPQLVRVHLGGDAFAGFVDEADAVKLSQTDKYVKFLFAKPGSGLEPPYDLDALRETLGRDELPVRRTYTVRSVDHDARTIAVDFVVHGDEGLAGPWAAKAQPGDRVALSGPGGGYAPADGDVTYLYVADDSAIPALAAALEALPHDARGIALIEVADTQSEVGLAAPAGVQMVWLHRDGAAAAGGTAPYGALLVDAVRRLERPAGAVDVFAHGEREAIKRIGAILNEEWGIPRQEMSLSAYWADGRSEDAFQSEKRTPIGQIFTD